MVVFIFLCCIVAIIISSYLYYKSKQQLQQANLIKIQRSEEQNELNNKIQQLTTQKQQIEHELLLKESEFENIKTIAQQKNQLELEQFKNSTAAAANSYFSSLDQLYDEKEKEFNNNIAILDLKYGEAQQALLKIENTRKAAMEATLREQEIKEKQNFYIVQLDPRARKDIQILESVSDQLIDARPLYMVIWTSYYSKKVNDMCNRVLGPNKRTGIYKITYQPTNQCYIGQARDIKERWREHIKAGSCKIDTPAGNKLYNIMAKSPISDFTFELLEECSVEELNEKEKYYIGLYQAYEFGYNSTKGNNK